MKVIKMHNLDNTIRKKAISFDDKNLITLEDRGWLNDRIRKFKKMAEQLSFLRRAVSQNPPGAQKILKAIIDSRIMSSYPEYENMLNKAYYPTARDNYRKFAEICDAVLEKIYGEITRMEKIRKDFIHKVLPRRIRERNEMAKERKNRRRQNV